tara:strand:- start:798 stop:1535 length:738 start_codon:yes stop_codon:yes gene_type:complete
MNLNGKVIIVTGSEGLIGKSIVNNIKLNGGTPLRLDILNNNNLTKNKFFLDVSSKKSINETLKLISGKYKKIDGLVNNAYPKTDDWGKKFEETSEDSFSKNVELQLSSIFKIIKPISKLMIKEKYGSIVNISSIYGIVGNDFSIYENTNLTSPVAYPAIKAGLIGLSRYLCSYLGKYGIRSNCVSPGGVFNKQNNIFVSQYCKKVPLNRMANPGDISPIVSFLLSDGSSYITGQNIAVDGGWTAI